MKEEEMRRMHLAITKFELMGSWYLAQYLREILHDMIKGSDK
jgi:hypothetical protein